MDSTVESLLLPFSHVWNASLIRHLFCRDDVAFILNLHVPRANIADKLIWTADGQGTSLHSVHSLIFKLGQQSSSLVADDWKKIWCLPLPDRLKLLLWKIAWAFPVWLLLIEFCTGILMPTFACSALKLQRL